MSKSAQWVAVTLDAVADELSTTASDTDDMRQAADFIRQYEPLFDKPVEVSDEEASIA